MKDQMNDLIGKNNSIATTESLIAGLQQLGVGIKTADITPLLKLSKQGLFVYGPDSIEVEAGSSWAMNPYSLMHGYACWGDGELLDEVMVPFTDPMPSREALENYNYPWVSQLSVILKCMDGEDEGVTVLYKGTSLGMRQAIKPIIAQIIMRAQSGSSALVPLVELDSDSYEHKKYGTTYTPELHIVDWVDISTGTSTDESKSSDATPAIEEEKEPPKQEESAPRRRKKAVAEDAAETPEPKAAPRRRRKRSA